jgi:hypothetical protein
MPRSLLAAVVLAAGLSIASAAQAATVFVATLSGGAEAPPNASPGTGTATLTLLDDNNYRLEVSYSGLTTPVTAAHIHGPTAAPGTGTAGVMTPVPTYPGFPTTTSGAYDQSFNLLSAASYNPAFVTNNGGTAATARLAFLGAVNDGKAYLNIHTSQFGGGEIRGFFSAVPEPGTWALMIVGFGLTGLVLRRRMRAVA